MTQVSQPVSSTRLSRSEPPRKYLYGVQGLRTVAALLVAVYHIWFGRVSGGVDVFFVVAGFFATGSLVRLFGKADDPRGAFASFMQYLMRTARRVIPSAVVVVVATSLASIVLMPKVFWEENMRDAWASLGFFENWLLIVRSSDYLQDGLEASAFQQFWALGVNVQFYLLFAVFVLGISLRVRARHGTLSPARMGRGIYPGVIAIFIASFAFSIWYTSYNQPAAYFSTFTRLWEFMAGSLVALMLRKDLSRTLGPRLVGWLGLGLLLGFGAFFNLSELLPGYLSMVPVLAAVGLLVSSWAGVEPEPLKWKPMLWVADSSFALYLWHWPLLVFYRYRYGTDIPFWAGMGIILLSLVLAVATTKLVEDPIRNSSFLKRSALATTGAMVALLLLGVGCIAVWQNTLESSSTAQERSVAQSSAQMQSSSEQTDDAIPEARDSYRPSLEAARKDSRRRMSDDCNQNYTNAELKSCEWGNPSSETHIALVGGSHSAQWIEPVIQGGQETDALITSYTMNRCVFGDVEGIDQELEPACEEWNERLIQTLLEDPPDVVVTIATRFIDGEETIPDGYRTYFALLSDAGIPVVAIRDNPKFPFDPPVCVDLEGPENCFILRNEVYKDLEELDVPQLRGFTFVDMVEDYCQTERCYVTDGDILIYRDLAHITNTWAIERGGTVADAIRDVLAEQD